ncbi:MAG TPA: hypothetical protein DCY94_05360, partial [Firmicutes bacterium]|nr:hypothetical protein [Bacillota bacterium]
LYFTLPMALNYQRNSYILWESACKTYEDLETRFVFDPKECLERTFEEVQQALTKYKIALQKQKQTEIWLTLCRTFIDLFGGDIRKLFNDLDYDVDKIRNFIQVENKKKFPYLSGTKICNYWLYVLWQYTDLEYVNVGKLNVAPDTHVIKSSHRLGLINDEEMNSSNVQNIVIDRWNKLFEGTNYKPIDIHTALWLWSRNGFVELDEEILDDKVIKSKVKNSYEKNDYLKKFRTRGLVSFEEMVFEKVANLIPSNGSILDLGCGNGYPYDRYFCSRDYNLVGVDFCEKHILQARKINPNAEYVVEDIEKYKINKEYDLVMMLFSLLHLPRKSHRNILSNMYNGLKNEGILLLTLRDEDAGEIKYKKDFCNEEMLWSYFDYKTYINMLEDIGFKVIFS